MYCALEGMILVASVHHFLPSIPQWVLIVFFGLIVIPLNRFGIKQLDKLQKWSLPIFFLFLIAAIIMNFTTTSVYEDNFWTYMPESGGWNNITILYWNTAWYYGTNSTSFHRLYSH